MEEIESILKKYPDFIDWLSKESQKQKELAELANAFTTVYNFLEDHKRLQSSNLTTQQLTINSIHCIFKYKLKFSECNSNSSKDNDLKNKISTIIYSLLRHIKHQNINEEIFEDIKISYLNQTIIL
ncbi:Mlp family lipoprotein (plasmid) [Borrelia miyamotoi]|uniref:Mlp family lipoprotein n=1 Tax=Borrelia miyamotoi TaxID=47466 RepID=A0AAX3JNX9_9SPIR|nr:Mlp family lipoprotein [Borrelia miyamotoi]WAZ72338.1 Mlp family lipoprotein [Borrelia miyamotoi]